MENKYMYHVPYARPIPYLDRTLLRARNLDIEEYKPVGKWIPANDFYAGIYWGDVDVDDISEKKAMEMIAYKDKKAND